VDPRASTSDARGETDRSTPLPGSRPGQYRNR